MLLDYWVGQSDTYCEFISRGSRYLSARPRQVLAPRRVFPVSASGHRLPVMTSNASLYSYLAPPPPDLAETVKIKFKAA